MLAIFARKGDINGTARAALSVISSIAVTPLLGLILNSTRWGITIQSVSCTVGAFILVTSAVGSLRQMRLAPDRRFAIELRLARPAWGSGPIDVVTTGVMIMLGLGVLLTAGYLIAKPKLGEVFTEFSIVGQDSATRYPKDLKIGEQGGVTIDVTNDEGRDVTYRIVVACDGEKPSEIGPFALVNHQKWEKDLQFSFSQAGQNQRVEFLLYKDAEVQSYLGPLYLWVDVTE